MSSNNKATDEMTLKSEENDQSQGAALLPQEEIAVVIERASRLQIDSLAKEREIKCNASCTMDEIMALGKELDIPEEFMERALTERLAQRNSILLPGKLNEARNKVLKSFIAQCPAGARLERKSEYEFTIHFPMEKEHPFFTLYFQSLSEILKNKWSYSFHFIKGDKGQIQVLWENNITRTSNPEKSSQRAGIYCLLCAAIAGTIHLMGYVGALMPAALLAIFGLLFIYLPKFYTLDETEADRLVQDMMSTAKELYLLEYKE